ncbi:hypothetical protein CCACVL1_22520, partial [Corchorus capsularis]
CYGYVAGRMGKGNTKACREN